MQNKSIAQMIAEAQDAPAFFGKESKIGDAVTMVIENISIRQTRDFRTKKPETWEDGSPKEQFVIIGKSDTLAKSKDDDGLRSVYIKWWGKMRKDFAKVIIESGYSEPAEGGTLTMRYSGEQPEAEVEKGFDAEKYYSFAYAGPE